MAQRVISGYIGGLLEYGDIDADNSIGSACIFFGADTPVGPMQFGIGATDKGHMS